MNSAHHRQINSFARIWLQIGKSGIHLFEWEDTFCVWLRMKKEFSTEFEMLFQWKWSRLHLKSVHWMKEQVHRTKTKCTDFATGWNYIEQSMCFSCCGMAFFPLSLLFPLSQAITLYGDIQTTLFIRWRRFIHLRFFHFRILIGNLFAIELRNNNIWINSLTPSVIFSILSCNGCGCWHKKYGFSSRNNAIIKAIQLSHKIVNMLSKHFSLSSSHFFRPHVKSLTYAYSFFSFVFFSFCFSLWLWNHTWTHWIVGWS